MSDQSGPGAVHPQVRKGEGRPVSVFCFASLLQVDGLLFAQVDEEMLAQDLGVASKLHQKKIMLHIQLRKESTCLCNGSPWSFSCIVAEEQGKR